MADKSTGGHACIDSEDDPYLEYIYDILSGMCPSLRSFDQNYNTL